MNTSLQPKLLVRIMNSEGVDSARLLTSSVTFITHAKDTFQPKYSACAFKLKNMVLIDTSEGVSFSRPPVNETFRAGRLYCNASDNAPA